MTVAPSASSWAVMSEDCARPLVTRTVLPLSGERLAWDNESGLDCFLLPINKIQRWLKSRAVKRLTNYTVTVALLARKVALAELSTEITEFNPSCGESRV